MIKNENNIKLFLCEVGFVIGVCVNENDEGYLLEYPFILQRTEQGMAVQPLFIREEKAIIKKHKIVFELEPTTGTLEIYNKYKTQIFSGIIVPDEKKIIL